MKKPTFFISSTIYDFKDLRSALKFYLEEQGCAVQASEFNDFSKPLDKHSYDACLSAIHNADYFLLLIGNRVGGWYDETARISITQQEYREAYALQQAGKIKLLNFVRTDVWRAKEDRKELAKHLESLALDESAKRAVINYPSRLLSDSNFISDFINEVGRNQETKKAIVQKSAAPIGNWLHVFDNFKDIVDVLNAHVFSSTPVEEMTLKRLLRRELREFLRASLIRGKDSSAFSPWVTIHNFHKEHEITLELKKHEYTTVGTKRWDMLSSFAIHLLGLRLHPVILPQALTSSAFLEYDLDADTYKETPAYEAMFLLQEEMRKVNLANTSETMSVVFEHTPIRRNRHSQTVEVATMKLISLLHLMDRWANVIQLSGSLLHYIDTGIFHKPQLRPISPMVGMAEQIENEVPTDTEIDNYLLGHQWQPHG